MNWWWKHGKLSNRLGYPYKEILFCVQWFQYKPYAAVQISCQVRQVRPTSLHTSQEIRNANFFIWHFLKHQKRLIYSSMYPSVLTLFNHVVQFQMLLLYRNCYLWYWYRNKALPNSAPLSQQWLHAHCHIYVLVHCNPGLLGVNVWVILFECCFRILVSSLTSAKR